MIKLNRKTSILFAAAIAVVFSCTLQAAEVNANTGELATADIRTSDLLFNHQVSGNAAAYNLSSADFSGTAAYSGGLYTSATEAKTAGVGAIGSVGGFASGSSYASSVSAVGSSSPSGGGSAHPGTPRKIPILPPDVVPDPVGEVPFLLLLLLAGGYLYFRQKTKDRCAER